MFSSRSHQHCQFWGVSENIDGTIIGNGIKGHSIGLKDVVASTQTSTIWNNYTNRELKTIYN